MSPCLTNGRLTLCRPPASQPLTRWTETIDLGGKHGRHTFHHRTHPRRQVQCHKCRRRRWAANLRIIAQAWYDPMIFCGHG